MQSTSIPAKFPKPFAANVVAPYIRPIPTDSQVAITPGAASLETGFPPLNFQPETSGGIPPFGQDFNGIFNMLSLWTQWQNAGAQVPFDQTFATAIGGYPKGAMVFANAGTFWYQSLIENNTSNPNTGSITWQQVVPSSPSTLLPIMDGAASFGVSLAFARADHVHPTDTSRAALTYVNSTFETIAAANSTFLPIINPTASGNMTLTGDLYVRRASATNTGLIFMNQAADRYLYYDGANYVFAIAELYVGNLPVRATINTAQATANTAVSNAAAAQGTANTAIANAATAQGTANTALASAIGSGQTYTNMTGSRALGVTYTNSTARPIYVFLRFTSVSGSRALDAQVNGQSAATMSAVSGSSEGCLSFIVPAGQNYIVNTGGFVNFGPWYELR